MSENNEDKNGQNNEDKNGQESSPDQEMSENNEDKNGEESSPDQEMSENSKEEEIEQEVSDNIKSDENKQETDENKQETAAAQVDENGHQSEDVLQNNKNENSGEEEVVEEDDSQEEDKGEGEEMEETETKLSKTPYMTKGNQGGHLLVAGDFRYRFRFRRKAGTAKNIFWMCFRKTCRTPLQTNIFDLDDEEAEIIVLEEGEHNHGPEDADVLTDKEVVIDNKEIRLDLPELRKRERIRQREMQILKKKNIELTNITKRLEEKVRVLEKLVGVADHVIRGKKVGPKKAKAAGQGKVIVHGLKPELTDEEIFNLFSEKGAIVEIERPFDMIRNQPKGFCLITFEEESVITSLTKTAKQDIGGHWLEIKMATPQVEVTPEVEATPKVEFKKAPYKPDAMARGGKRGGRGGVIRGGRGGVIRGGRGGVIRGGRGGVSRGGRGGVVRGRGRGRGQERYDYGQGGYSDYGEGYYDYDYGHGSHSGYGEEYVDHGSGGYGNYYGNEGYNGKRQRGRPPIRHHPY